MPRFNVALLLIVLGLIVAGVWSRHTAYFAVSAIVALIAISSWRASAHLRNAAKGAAEGRRVQGEVQIDVTEWTDEPTYHATVKGADQRLWQFEFIPQGWTPRAGKVPAEFRLIPGVDWPVLILTHDGILYPRRAPAVVEDS